MEYGVSNINHPLSNHKAMAQKPSSESEPLFYRNLYKILFFIFIAHIRPKFKN